MTNKIFTIGLIGLFLLFSGCNSETLHDRKNGTFRGYLTITFMEENRQPEVRKVSLWLNNGIYSLATLDFDNLLNLSDISATHFFPRESGTYSIKSGKIEFAVDINAPVYIDNTLFFADILHCTLYGKYHFRFDGEKLVLWKETSYARYEYVLERTLVFGTN